MGNQSWSGRKSDQILDKYYWESLPSPNWEYFLCWNSRPTRIDMSNRYKYPVKNKVKLITATLKTDNPEGNDQH
jgi:hypothetical protein